MSGFKNSVIKATLLMASLQIAHAQQPEQRTFGSAEEASHALFVAVEADETDAIAQILGKADELTSSSDTAQDKLERQQFIHKYQEMHRLARRSNGEVALYIGAENWPFPIPLVSHNGSWRYDADAGAKEVLYRRIGENEETAIETCHTLVVTPKEPQASGVSYRGYTFRVLPSGKSSTVVAYPTAYGTSGVMTFIVGASGVVYQKDLGANTQRIATRIGAYQRDSTWVPAETEFQDPG